MTDTNNKEKEKDKEKDQEKTGEKKKGRKMSSEYQKPEFINITVSEAVTHNDETGKPSYTDYLITVNTTFPEYTKQQFFVRRRYREFVWLKDHLRQKMEEKGKRLTIAELPGNTFSSWVGPGRYDKEFIEERRVGLEDFMRSVVNHPWARFEPGLHKFLQDQDFKCE